MAEQASSDVRIIIISFNGGAMLERCVNSVFAQIDQNFELLIIDNGSDDDCLERLPNDPRLCIRKMSSNLGFCVANNIAIDSCKTPLVALLNQDAYPNPDWLEKLKLAALHHPGVVMFASVLLKADAPDLLDGAGDAYYFAGTAWRGGYGQPRAGFVLSGEPFAVCAAAALYRTAAIKAIGGFDESFGSYGEDVDLSFRLRLQGGRALLVPGAVALHVGSASGSKNPDKRTIQEIRNQIWVFIKNMPGILFWGFLPFHLAFHVLLFAKLTLNGRWTVARSAYGGALKGLGRILRQRRALQKQKKIGAFDILPFLTFNQTAVRRLSVVLRKTTPE